MSIRAGDSETFLVEGNSFSTMDGERVITTPAKLMCIRTEDIPTRWVEKRVSVMNQPRFGQRDYASARFCIEEGGLEKAIVSFETVVYKDAPTASGVFVGTLKSLGFLNLSKLQVGDMGAMVEVPGQPSRRLRAVLFAERNVFGLILLSHAKDSVVSDSWLISMARLMVSRMR